MKASLLFILFLILLPVDSVSQMIQDSSDLWLSGSVTAAYAQEDNGKNNHYSTLAFQGFSDIIYKGKLSNNYSYQHVFKSEISYLHYIDSTWIISSDYFKLLLQWNKSTNKKWENTWAFYLSSRWLNKYENVYIDGEQRNKWLEGFLNPARFEFSYGWNNSFWKCSSFSGSLASIKISSIPRNELYIQAKEKNLLVTKHSYIQSEYGMSLQLLINESYFKDLIVWRHQSRVFANAFNKSGVHIDVNNRIAVRFLKFIELRFDTKIFFDPDYNSHLQFRQEVLLGVFYQHQQKVRSLHFP